MTGEELGKEPAFAKIDSGTVHEGYGGDADHSIYFEGPFGMSTRTYAAIQMAKGLLSNEIAVKELVVNAVIALSKVGESRKRDSFFTYCLSVRACECADALLTKLAKDTSDA